MNRFVPKALHEYGIRRADLDAEPIKEGQVGRLNVVWSPPQEHGVERDHECGEACSFDPVKNGNGNFLGPWPGAFAIELRCKSGMAIRRGVPVELVPTLTIRPVCFCDILD